MSLQIVNTGPNGSRPKCPPPRTTWLPVQPLHLQSSNPRPSSIDTPVHTSSPPGHVDHTHPNAVIAVAGFGELRGASRAKIMVMKWPTRPAASGFELGLAMQKPSPVKTPKVRGFMHGPARNCNF